MTNNEDGRQPVVRRTNEPQNPKAVLVVGVLLLIAGVVGSQQESASPAFTTVVAIVGALAALYGVIVLAMRAGRRD